jgi:soluble lytic murein transglycosylase-like protein
MCRRWTALARASAVVHDVAVVAGLAAVLLAAAHDVGVAPGSETVPPPVSSADPGVLPMAPPVEIAIAPIDPRRQALAGELSQRYRIAFDAAETVVDAAYLAGDEVGTDPLLVLAVIAVESSFNPIAESLAGAKGLMQIVPRYHEDKLRAHGGSGAILDPAVNILVGARILDQYVRRSGDLEAGLRRYNGSSSDPSSRYTRKVLAERERLRQVVAQVERTQVAY